MRTVLIAVSAFWSCATGALAQASPQPIDAAFANMGPTTSAGWSFVRTTLTANPQRLQVERFTPAGGWALVAVNNAPPTASDLGKYRKTKLAPNNTQNNHDLRAMIRDATLTKTAEDAEHLSFSFQARSVDPGDPITDHLSGELTIRKGARPFVERYRLFAAAPFSARGGIHGQQFDSILSFSPVTPDGPVFLTESQSLVIGRYVVLPVNIRVTARYTDYRRP